MERERNTIARKQLTQRHCYHKIVERTVVEEERLLPMAANYDNDLKQVTGHSRRRNATKRPEQENQEFPRLRTQEEGDPFAAAQQPERLFSDALWLRDACQCPQCVDQSTRQKLFQSSDIPFNVKAKVVAQTDAEIEVAWENDLPAYGSDHISTYQISLLSTHNPSTGRDSEVFSTEDPKTSLKLWGNAELAESLKSIEFADYQASEDAVFEALKQLRLYGIVLLKGAPLNESSVETIAHRIGHLRETFYGRTWDVKSVPQAKNVAYTNQYLGFHMDLLYMSDPPGLQMLHCLKNTCTGGTSMFSDAFKATRQLREEETVNGHYNVLSTYPQTFHYKNAGEYYKFTRPVISHHGRGGSLEFVNWSPPFQAPFQSEDYQPASFLQYIKAAKAFSALVEAPENVYEYRMQEGDCIIFNNRRILHARQRFDTASGERWLKGAYLDTDVFNSRY